MNELNTLLICSFRYALGRMTYIVSDIVDIIIHHKKDLQPNAKELMIREIKWALDHNQAGMRCDREEWERLLNELTTNN